MAQPSSFNYEQAALALRNNPPPHSNQETVRTRYSLDSNTLSPNSSTTSSDASGSEQSSPSPHHRQRNSFDSRPAANTKASTTYFDMDTKEEGGNKEEAEKSLPPPAYDSLFVGSENRRSRMPVGNKPLPALPPPPSTGSRRTLLKPLPALPQGCRRLNS